ncbi:hypothetical protein T10_9675 [Trichinella papuae]|uniref:Uncharacterized protein n=1 Tax=Trichinella papuae TaxID=268474 RepID=A0A0V1N7E3_9BILA|nr:hypothetical protein T10_9675 [Trichinella papuae]
MNLLYDCQRAISLNSVEISLNIKLSWAPALRLVQRCKIDLSSGQFDVKGVRSDHSSRNVDNEVAMNQLREEFNRPEKCYQWTPPYPLNMTTLEEHSTHRLLWVKIPGKVEFTRVSYPQLKSSPDSSQNQVG